MQGIPYNTRMLAMMSMKILDLIFVRLYLFQLTADLGMICYSDSTRILSLTKAHSKTLYENGLIKDLIYMSNTGKTKYLKILLMRVINILIEYNVVRKQCSLKASL